MAHIGGSHLLEKLLHFEEGVKKYGTDPKFPDLSRIGDVAATHDLLAGSLMQSSASRAKAKEDDGAARAMTTRATVLYQKLVLAVQLYAGKRSDVLRAFGLTPYRVGGRKKHKGAAATAHGGKGHGTRTHGPSGGTSGGTSDGAGGGASGGAGEAAGGGSTGASSSAGSGGAGVPGGPGSGGSSGSASGGR